MPTSAELRGTETEQALDALECACQFFRDCFPGTEAEAYMTQKRGFKQGTLKQFRIGFAPNSWDALKDHLFSQRYDAHVLEAVGLIGRKEGGNHFYSSFRNRIMFPYLDDFSGKVVGFGGRAMTKEDAEFGKYRNTRETQFFKKGRLLYGFNFTQKAINQTKQIVLVEGYTDAMMAHQVDAKNTTALVGVELTDEHLRMLSSRYADCDWVFCTDADSAGLRAAAKAVEKTKAAPNIKVCALPKGTDDPAKFIQDGNDFKSYLRQHSEPGFSFYVFQMREDQKFEDPGSELRFLQKMAPLMLSVPENQRGVYIDVLSSLTDIKEKSIESFLYRKAEKKIENTQQVEKTRRQLAEEKLVRTLIAHGKQGLIRHVAGILRPEHFSSPESFALYKEITSYDKAAPIFREEFPFEDESGKRQVLEKILAESDLENMPDEEVLQALLNQNGVPKPTMQEIQAMASQVLAYSIADSLSRPNLGIQDIQRLLQKTDKKMRQQNEYTIR